MKLRHNKKRNTAFLYEALVRELTKAIIRKDTQYKKKVVSAIKESFGKTTELRKELDLYRSLQESQNLKPYLAEKLIYEVRSQYKKIDKKKLFNEQSKLINKINRTLSKKVFSHYVPSYKNIATISQIFNDELLPKKRVLLEDAMVAWLAGKNEGDKRDAPTVNNLVIKKFVENFNDQYNSILLREQKELLQKYIFSFSDNGIEFKLYLNEELGRLKEIIKKSSYSDEIKSDYEMERKSKEVLKLMETFKEAPICGETIKKIIKIQNLVSEIQS